MHYMRNDPRSHELNVLGYQRSRADDDYIVLTVTEQCHTGACSKLKLGPASGSATRTAKSIIIGTASG